jgi:CDP-diacylglycerol--glycerol-3-phosphate 3-phosphatidyltransferase
MKYTPLIHKIPYKIIILYLKVNAFHEALSDPSRPELKCTLLLDYLRGSRDSHNSRTMVQNLVDQFSDRFRLCLYHTPNLRGFLKWVGPERFNEVMGLQHMKVYIFDNSLVISG